jgi:hypothetical protein
VLAKHGISRQVAKEPPAARHLDQLTVKVEV